MVCLCVGVLLLPVYRGSSKWKKKKPCVECEGGLGHDLKWFFSPYRTRRWEPAFVISQARLEFTSVSHSFLIPSLWDQVVCGKWFYFLQNNFKNIWSEKRVNFLSSFNTLHLCKIQTQGNPTVRLCRHVYRYRLRWQLSRIIKMSDADSRSWQHRPVCSCWSCRKPLFPSLLWERSGAARLSFQLGLSLASAASWTQKWLHNDPFVLSSFHFTVTLLLGLFIVFRFWFQRFFCNRGCKNEVCLNWWKFLNKDWKHLSFPVTFVTAKHSKAKTS